MPGELVCQLSPAALRAAAEALARRLRPRLLAAAGAGAAGACTPLPYAVAYKSRLPEARARTGAAEPGAAAAARPSGIADGTAAAAAPAAHGAVGEDAGRSSEPDVAASGAPPPGAAVSAGARAAGAEPAAAHECTGAVPTAPCNVKAASAGQAAEEAHVGGSVAVHVQRKVDGKPDQAPERAAVLAALAAGLASGTAGAPAMRVDLRNPRVQPVPCAPQPVLPFPDACWRRAAPPQAMFKPCFHQLPRRRLTTVAPISEHTCIRASPGTSSNTGSATRHGCTAS